MTTFIEATDALMRQWTAQQLAEHLSVSIATVRQARLAEGQPNKRPPPRGWEPILADILEQRAGADLAIAKQLRRGTP